MNTPVISDLVKYARLAYDLRDFLKQRISLEQSKQVLSARVRNRERNFLSLIKKGIYGYNKSPYLKLLRIAGCEFGDIEEAVKKDGIETTLQKLLTEGVYLSWEEFKGKRDVVRGTNRFRFKDTDFYNPYLAGHYEVRSSGSRSAGTRALFDLKHRLETTYYLPVMLVVHDAFDVPMGQWYPELPSVAGISHMLRHWLIGQPVVKWFSPVTEGQTRASLRDRLATRYIVYGGRVWGAKLVAPEHVGLTEAVKVAQWIAKTKRDFGGCSLSCMVSLGVMVCQAAMKHRLDIEGTHLFVAGEPVTEAKREQMEAVGVSVAPMYHITEVGFIGCGCPSAGATDDVHLFHDSVTLIQRNRKVEHTDIFVDSFLFTSLLPSSPMIMLNVESDDYGVVHTESCGCLFEKLGFTRHMRHIRSFGKLTGSGMTILGSDFVRILEEVLPQKYGGAATDYQLVEEEDNQGRTRLSLVINPSVGDIDERKVIDTVINELRKGVHGGKLASGLWSQVETIQVKRMSPISSSGKVLTLHLLKKQRLRS